MAQLLVVILNDLTLLPKLLDSWQEIGLPGTTILDSAGARRAKNWLYDVGLGAVSELLRAKAVQNKTLFSVIDDDAILERAITATEEIMGDLNTLNKGILFTVPLSQVRGLIKYKQSEKDMDKDKNEDKTTPPATDGKLITRKTAVSVVNEILNLKPTIVSTDLDLMHIAEAMLKNPNVAIACVVNDRQRLVGLLPLDRLADDLFLEVIPEEFLSHAKDIEDALNFADMSRTHTAGDAMVPAVSVKNDDLVRDAFRKMHDHKLSGVPIVNDQNEVTGYINLLELLALYAHS